MLPRLMMEGRLGSDPDLRFAPSGKAVGRLRLVANDRKREGDTWVDGPALWINATVFGQQAENCAESLRKGDLVTVTGRLSPNTWTDKEGVEHHDMEIVVDDVGTSLRWRSTPHSDEQVTRTATKVADDPWATNPSTPTGGGNPPF